MNRKGFTLIELLAVIVILAIIALIVIPLILNVIEKSKRGSFLDSAYGILKSAEYTYLKSEMFKKNPQDMVFRYEDWEESSNISCLKLKAINYWNNNGNGTDEYGFNWLPTGYRYHSTGSLNIDSIGSNLLLWSSTSNGSGAWYRYDPGKNLLFIVTRMSRLMVFLCVVSRIKFIKLL